MDGAHTHGHGGGGVPPEAFMLIALAAVAVVVGPIVIAILHAIAMILLITGIVAAFAAGTYLAIRILRYLEMREYAKAGQAIPLQQRGNRRAIPSPSKRRAITASTEGKTGHIILTAKEYEEIRQQRYDNR